MVFIFEGFACATQSTRLRDYKTTSGCRMMLRYRFADLCFAHASQTTSLQDNETTSGCRGTSCLVD